MLTAKDIMTETVISVSPNDSLAEAMELIVENDISGLPVIDHDGRLVGIISELDRIKMMGNDIVEIAGALVVDAMTHGVITVDETANLNQIADLLVRASIRRLPVTSNGHVVGIVGRRDLVHALDEEKLLAITDIDRANA